MNRVLENEIVAFANAELYSKDSVFKCTYWYCNDFHCNIDIVNIEDNQYFKIVLVPLEQNKHNLKLVLKKLENDLIDFNLRDIVTKETKNIRDLLIAKAFSNGEFDENPPGEVTDPVGFNIS
ncbi:His-Xaa-Ser system protein HxsD [Myroides phaeus]|uniref:His-Xaa-Ser system protein HxsD n=1 Tax=Myroides phaeus TaxID=702745 RepID=UPI001302FF45|nr:His-Xaa-Ser system protein HxsD [Myroides phaeus]